MAPWTDAQKREFVEMQFKSQVLHYSSQYSNSLQQVIERDGVRVGRLYLNRTADELEILDFTVLPEHRGFGTGSAVIEGILDEARRTARSARIFVESYSPHVSFFEHRGFERTKEEGMNVLMVWRGHDEPSRRDAPDAGI